MRPIALFARRDLVIPLVLAALLLAVRLAGPRDMECGGDQAKTAQYVLYAWNTGHLLVPLEKGEKLPTKPPLAVWVALASARLAGDPSELALWMPSVLEGLLLVLFTVLLARRLAPPPVPLLAGLAVAGNLVFVQTATILRPDMLHALLVLLAVGAALRALDGEGRRWGILSFFWLGLAVLAKGPAALVFGGAAVVPFALLRRDRPSLRRLSPGPGGAVLLLVVLAWAVPAFLQKGDALVRTMVTGELTRHAVGARQPIYQYLFIFPGRFLPWVFALPFGLALAGRARKADPSFRLGLPLCWFAGGFLAMSLFSSKRADYLLPLLPAAAVLSGAAIARLRRAVPLALAGFLLFLAGLVVVDHVIPERFREPGRIKGFVERVREAVPRDRPLLVYRTGSGANVVLYYLRRSKRPSRLPEVEEAVRERGTAYVLTNPRGEREIAGAGIPVRRLLEVERGSRGPPYFLLRAGR